MTTEEGCIFCDIVKEKINSWKVYQDKWATAFLDINPRNPGHTLVISNNHHKDILDLPEEEAGPLFEAVRKVSVAIVNGTDADGVSIAQSSGASAGQLIRHMHFHVIPRFSDQDPVSIEGIMPIKKSSKIEKENIVKKIAANIPKK